MMYPPPPGYFGPPGPGFPQNGSPFPPPMPPPGQRPLPDQEPNELPVNDRGHPSGHMRSPSRVSTVSPHPGPTPPNDSKPSVSEALAPVSTLPTSAPLGLPQSKKPTSRSGLIAPALPLLVNNRSNAPLVAHASKPVVSGNSKAEDGAPTQIAVEEANRRARAAVANAMAKMNHGQSTQTPTAHPKPIAAGNPVEMLTQNVVDMKIPDPRGDHRDHRGRGSSRGRGYRGGHQVRNVEIPKSDYDFESANAKFNKEDMIKEAIASGSPIAEVGEESASLNATATANGEKRKDSLTSEVYNKSSSFFDNLSSELKDREEGNPNNRMARGQELKKNVETFGQGSVDAGFRGRGRGFRGRGRGHGGHGYNQRGYGYARGGAGGVGGGRGRGRSDQVQTQPAQPASGW